MVEHGLRNKPRWVVRLAWVVVALGSALGLAWLRWDGPMVPEDTGTWKVFGDSVWLLVFARQFAGATPEEALSDVRAWLDPLMVDWGFLSGIAEAGAGGFSGSSLEALAGVSQRYVAIFESRPLASLLLAPLTLLGPVSIPLFAIGISMVASGVVALSAWRFGRVGIASAVGALSPLVAILAFYAFPTGFWSTRFLYESTTYLFVVAIALMASELLAKGDGATIRTRLAWALIPLSLLGLLARPSYVLPMVGGVAGLLLMAGALDRFRDRDRVISGVGLVAVVAAYQGLAAQQAWPQFNETLQDKFTVHFTQPDVADPYGAWLTLLADTVPAWRELAMQNWVWIAVVLLSLGYLVGRFKARGLPFAFIAVVGVLNVVAHPVISELPRLLSVAFLPAAVAAGAAAQPVAGWLRHAVTGRGFVQGDL